MNNTTINSFQVIGISVRTTNENGKSAKDIEELWNNFLEEAVAAKIPNKIDTDIVSLYTNYEIDETKPYDTILGCRVSSLSEIPEGLVGQTFEGGNYAEFVSKGNLNKGAVYETWKEIWKTDLNRKYSVDFEVYGHKAQNPLEAEVNIFVALKS